VFGFDTKDKVKDHFAFHQNNLVITSIDIQSVEPVDQRTRDSLMKSVQLAIEITTNSQEATARYAHAHARNGYTHMRTLTHVHTHTHTHTHGGPAHARLLMKSVQLAIEITTNSQEAAARY
jgi:hypothetical protein